jgi:hypothetical protein
MNEPASPKKGDAKKEGSLAKPGEKSVNEPSKVRMADSADKNKKAELASVRSHSPGKRPNSQAKVLSTVGGHNASEKKLKLDEELRESSILAFLEKSAHHKDRLDVSLLERTKKDLVRDKQRMKELMNKQKFELLEMAQKRSTSAYVIHEGPKNAKIRELDYLADLNKPAVLKLQNRYQKDMEQILNYEISLKVSMRDQDHQTAA